jgi:hypothetical protein
MSFNWLVQDDDRGHKTNKKSDKLSSLIFLLLFLIFLTKYGISYVCKVPGSSNHVFFRSKVTISLTTKNLLKLNNFPHNIILPGNFVSISYLWTYYIRSGTKSFDVGENPLRGQVGWG